MPLSFAFGEAYQFDRNLEIALINGVTTNVAHVRLSHTRDDVRATLSARDPGGVRRARTGLRLLRLVRSSVRSSSVVLNARGQSKFSFKARMKRSATPLPSGWRAKDGEASMPRHLIWSWNVGHVIGAMIVTKLSPRATPARWRRNEQRDRAAFRLPCFLSRARRPGAQTATVLVAAKVSGEG